MKSFFLQILRFRYLFLIFVLLSILYLIPGFNFKYKNKFYTFRNLPSLAQHEKENLNFDIPNVTQTFRYEIESTQVNNDKDWNKNIFEDQKTLERRVESFLSSNNYEIRLDKRDNKGFFSIYTTKNIGQNTEVFTANNSDFKVSVATPSASAEPTQEGQAPATDKKELPLKRKDFGIADINVQPGQEQNKPNYQIRMPLGLVGPEKIKIINENKSSTINISVGGKDYTASFSPNSNDVITHLVITSAQSIDEAFAVKTFLNTDAYKLGYKYNSVEVKKPEFGLYKLLSVILLFLFGGYLINRLTVNNLAVSKILYISGITIIGLGLAKLIGMDIVNGYIIVLMAMILMTFFYTRNVYYLAFAAALIIIRLLGYLYFFELTISNVFLLILLSTFIWGTNYVKKYQKQ